MVCSILYVCYASPMSEEEYDKTNPWILNKAIQLSERMLDSNKTANLLIIVLIVLAILPILGIGIALTRATAPINQIEISN